MIKTKFFQPGLFLLALVFCAGLILSGCGEPKQILLDQSAPPAKELNLKDHGLEVKISPTDGSKVKGILSVKILAVPAEAYQLLVMLSPQNLGPTNNPFAEPNVIGQYIKPDTKEFLLDTTKVVNGLYSIAVTAAKEKSEGYPWIAVAQAQVVVEN